MDLNGSAWHCMAPGLKLVLPHCHCIPWCLCDSRSHVWSSLKNWFVIEQPIPTIPTSQLAWSAHIISYGMEPQKRIHQRQHNWAIIQSLRIAVFEPINLYRPWFFEKHIKINISKSTNQNHPEFGDTNVNIWSTPNGCSTFKRCHPGLSFSGQAATGGLHVPATAGFHPKCLGTFLDLPGICR